MKYTTIRIEGQILSPDILDKIEQGELGGQTPKDFGFDGGFRVKDEIARSWADAQDLWHVFKHRMERVREGETGTKETRRYFLIPLLGILGYDVEISRAATLDGKSYAISHRAGNLDNFPVHVMGFRDSLDMKRQEGGPRMSPHALVQEYLNITEHLYALVTNGLQLRLLRDSSRLVKLTFLEFDLERMFDEDHYADFAILYRLIHSSRMPARQDAGAESIIEKYHQDALDAGARIREGLSEAIERSIKSLTNGFINHRDNEELRKRIESGDITEKDLYQHMLRLIYRILFLMVIEERNLVFTGDAESNNIFIYYNYYSISRLRRLSEKRYLEEQSFDDYWLGLKRTFRLFEREEYGKPLDIKPLAGDLFSKRAIGILNECNLENGVVLECIRNLNTFTNKYTGQLMRVNYAALNVEEFGSVYEGLLEYDAVLRKTNSKWEFDFVLGKGRSSTGTHYTPDELVQPLIKHSLDYIIEDRLKEKDPTNALLSIKVCDVACGSGHILLNAARRIATALAKVRTGEDQPSPSAFRVAVRDVIRNCIYGVDINPLAVELCKVAMWLEAHNPGEPLNFLDHHIKCGDAIVGLAHKEELEKGIANEAFKSFPNDDPETKNVCSELRKRNKFEREEYESELEKLEFPENIEKSVLNITSLIEEFNKLPEKTPEQIEQKQKKYQELVTGPHWWNLKAISDIQVAQFFIPKTKENEKLLVTDEEYRHFLTGKKSLQGQKVALSMAEADNKKFFHWFLEFPEVFMQGGFDCILGNPPFLGGKRISGHFGDNYLNHIKLVYAPALGGLDLVTYFFRRIYNIIKSFGYMSLISTNTIAQGDTRRGGLELILKYGGTIVQAYRSIKWPGLAAVEVTILTIYKGIYERLVILDNKKVKNITPFLDDTESILDPHTLEMNKNKGFIGSVVLGKGFILENEEVTKLISPSENNKDVIFKYLNGEDLNTNIDQSPSRYIINFFDFDEIYCRNNYPECFNIVENRVKSERMKSKDKGYREKWWQYGRRGVDLYKAIEDLGRVLVVAQTSKTLAFSFVPNGMVYAMMCVVFAFQKYSIFSLLQSSFHFHWCYKYGSTMKSDLRYTPSSVFETFPFPQKLSPKTEQELEIIGENYHEFRRKLMLKMKLGLTKTYNQFHNRELTKIDEDLTDEEFKMKFGKLTLELRKHLRKTEDTCSYNEAVEDIFTLRKLHKEMDEAVLRAYGWEDIDLAHDFYEVDYLPENDRIRYTISPEARREVLKRLLKLNHEIHEREVEEEKMKGSKNKKSKKKEDRETGKMF